jgi:ATP-dependent RNA circularization protein (DNA/RNA ligase family)
VQFINNPRDGKPYLARNHEAADACSFQIFDIRNRTQRSWSPT